jgi:hypothetical protein
MKFLQKILLIVVCYAFAGNVCVEGMAAVNGIVTVLPAPPVPPLALPAPGTPILDFNTIATVAVLGPLPIAATVVPESLQPKLYANPVVGAPDRRCVYFTVINNAPGAPGPAAFINAIANVPTPANEHNIYFPEDGSQPTTPEAVQYSCANIDNRENSPITEWYMKMFGVIPINPVHPNVFVQDGWNNAAPPIAQPIITCGFLGDLASDLHKIGELTIPNTPQLGNVQLANILNVAAMHTENKVAVDQLIIALENPAFNASVIIGTATAVINGIHAAIIASPSGTAHATNATTYAHNIANQIGIAVSNALQATVGGPAQAAANGAAIVTNHRNDATGKMAQYAGATAQDVFAINDLVAHATGAIGVVGPNALLNSDAVLDAAIQCSHAVIHAINVAVPAHGAGHQAARRAVNIAKDVEKAIKSTVKVLKESKQKLRLLSQKMGKNDKTIGVFVNEMEAFFKKNFRKIASTSVGRTLLCRILIEIRRHVANNVGILGNDATIQLVAPHATPADTQIRNSFRQIKIELGDGSSVSSVSSEGDKKIHLENSPTKFHCVVGERSGVDIRGNYDSIVRFEDKRDVSLFHEICHWYRSLRDPLRKRNEKNGQVNIRRFNGTATAPDLITNVVIEVVPIGSNNIGEYYYSGLGWDNMKESEKKWGKGSRANYEEMRNILGVPVPQVAGSPNFIHGDDLSENLYRMCIGAPLRFGHTGHSSYYEDSRVIDKVVKSCTLQKSHYNCTVKAAGDVDFVYGDGTKGLGSSEF